MMNPEKLARLRELANRSYMDELSDESLKSYMREETDEDDGEDEAGLRAFAGPFNFFRSEFARKLDGVDIALIGVPFDLGVRIGRSSVQTATAQFSYPIHRSIRWRLSTTWRKTRSVR